MKPIDSTAEILAFKMLGRNVNKKWIDWAYAMICAGFDTENLVILAGEMEPYNQYELQRLAEKVFKELNLKWDDRELVYKNYIYYLVNAALSGKMNTLVVLDMLKEIYMELNYKSSLSYFYMLYYAYDDLKYSNLQYYWDGATRENIDEIINAYFREWVAKYNAENN